VAFHLTSSLNSGYNKLLFIIAKLCLQVFQDRPLFAGVAFAGRIKRAPTEADAPFVAHRIEAYGILVSPDVGDSVLGWFTVTSTPFWSD
jgi:hypothetical protein